MSFIDYENEIKQKKRTWRCLIMLVLMPFFFFFDFHIIIPQSPVGFLVVFFF